MPPHTSWSIWGCIGRAACEEVVEAGLLTAYRITCLENEDTRIEQRGVILNIINSKADHELLRMAVDNFG